MIWRELVYLVNKTNRSDNGMISFELLSQSKDSEVEDYEPLLKIHPQSCFNDTEDLTEETKRLLLEEFFEWYITNYDSNSMDAVTKRHKDVVMAVKSIVNQTLSDVHAWPTTSRSTTGRIRLFKTIKDTAGLPENIDDARIGVILRTLFTKFLRNRYGMKIVGRSLEPYIQPLLKAVEEKKS